MTIPTGGNWLSEQTIQIRKYTCGHIGCGRDVGSEKGWHYSINNSVIARIHLCPMCERPTFIDHQNNLQIPGVLFGKPVAHLPDDVKQLYNEVRGSTGIGSYTSAVLGCRKLLMHIAVEKGAKAGMNFIEYVEYLVKNHYAPPGSEPWVGKIRTMGNEANHEIKIMTKAQAEELVNFVEMLLKFIYEFPAKINLQATI